MKRVRFTEKVTMGKGGGGRGWSDVLKKKIIVLIIFLVDLRKQNTSKSIKKKKITIFFFYWSRSNCSNDSSSANNCIASPKDIFDWSELPPIVKLSRGSLSIKLKQTLMNASVLLDTSISPASLAWVNSSVFLLDGCCQILEILLSIILFEATSMVLPGCTLGGWQNQLER